MVGACRDQSWVGLSGRFRLVAEHEKGARRLYLMVFKVVGTN